MSLAHSPSVVTNGLVYYHDMNNTKKSWGGWPVTNQFTLPTNVVNGFGVQNSTFTRIYSGTYGDYTIQPTDYVWQYNITGPDCPYHGWDIPTTAGTVVVWSFSYYVSPTTVGYPSTNYIANMENTGFGGGGGYADPTPSVIGVWKTGYIVSTATANGTARCLMYPGACGSQLATSGFILYKNPQVEFNPPGSVPSPFVAGTRSSSQTILDLTGKNTITANSLTYSSSGSASFGGSDYCTVGSITGSFSSFTVSVWFNSTSVSNYRNPIDCNYSSYPGVTGNVGPRLEQNSSGNLVWVVSGNSTNNSVADAFTVQSSGLSANTWYNAVITWTNGNANTYLNGVPVTVGASTPSGFVGTFGSVVIGKGFSLGGTERSFVGQVPNVQIYNRALSASEVLQNFNAIRGVYGI